MQCRLIMAALLVGAAIPAAAQQAQPAPAPASEAPKEDLVRVALDTEAGRIVLALDRGRAPVTTRNFLRYLESGRLDGINFYRAMKLWDGHGIVQAGVRDGAKLLPPVRHEPTSETGILHEDGTVAMARAKPGTAQGDFFITIGKVEGFDAGKDPSGDNLGFAAFGRVVDGMDVIRELLGSPVSATKGEKEGMKGQMLDPPVKIVKAVKLAE